MIVKRNPRQSSSFRRATVKFFTATAINSSVIYEDIAKSEKSLIFNKGKYF